MTTQFNYAPLTASGCGAVISDRKLTDFTKEEIWSLIDQYRWLAFKGNPVNEEEVGGFLGQFGNLTQNDRRKGVVLKLDGSKDQEGEVLLGEGFLPLHRDGALMGTNVALVGIFCVEFKNIQFGGRTFITDTEGALKDVPQEYIDLLRERGIEGKPVDRYYMKSADEWHHIPGFIEVEGKSYLNVGFPSPEGEKPSWLMRIPGVDDAKFREVFNALEKVMMDEKYCYYHDWKEGDLLLLDNRKTLHGREAFTGQRSLANIQVLV